MRQLHSFKPHNLIVNSLNVNHIEYPGQCDSRFLLENGLNRP